MRILIVDTCYPEFLRAHYSRTEGLAGRPYAEQWRSLMATFFGTADSYSHHLRPLGVEAHEVVANCAPLQAAWAREHGVSLPRLALPRERMGALACAHAEQFGADAVYVQNPHLLSPRAIGRLKQLGATIVGQIASRPPSGRKLRAFDLLLTSFPHYVERFRSAGVRAEYFRIGFDERVLGRLEGDAGGQAGGAVFVGALDRRAHREANAVLDRAARRTPIEFWGYGNSGWPASSPVRRDYRGQAWGLDMYRVLHGARIAVNRHIGEAGSFANNMRLYEATGVGTLLVTDAKANLGELFEVGQEVVTYEGEDSLVEAVNHYLANEAERAAIADAGQRRTLREHTYRHRMQELKQILERAL